MEHEEEVQESYCQHPAQQLARSAHKRSLSATLHNQACFESSLQTCMHIIAGIEEAGAE